MAEIFEVDVNKLPESFNQQDVENWDSLRHLSLIVELESAFGISFEPEEISKMNSFQSVIKFTKEKLPVEVKRDNSI